MWTQGQETRIWKHAVDRAQRANQFGAPPLGDGRGEATAWPALMGMGGALGLADPAKFNSSGAAVLAWRMPASWRGAGRTGLSVRPTEREGRV